MRRLLSLRSRVGPYTALAFALVFGMSAFATPVDITIYDGIGAVGEDGEVEPSAESPGTRPWDLEAMLFDPATGILSIVGEFPFASGIDGYFSGDIFIDLDPPSASYPNNDGSDYEYVIDITPATADDYGAGAIGANPTAGTPVITYSYTVYALTGATTTNGQLLGLVGGPGSVIPEGNPWRYETGGAVVATGNFDIEFYDTAALLNAAYPGLNPDPTGQYTGDNHYVMTGFDLLAFLTPGQIYGSNIHYTMECGNDQLLGHPVPEPASMVVLGIGLLGAAAAKRGTRRFKKS